MTRVVRQLLMVLIAFALLGGATLHAARAAAQPASMPCAMMAMPQMASQSRPAPCKRLTPDCIKQMGCVSDLALPVRLAPHGLSKPMQGADYWQAGARLAGLVHTPEPLPPRTL